MPPAAAARTLGDRRTLAAAGVFVGALAALTVFASLGGQHGPIEGLSWVLMLLARAGASPAAYLLAGAGIGRLALPLFRGSRDEWALQLAVGLGLMLSLSHALGAARLMAGPSGQMIAIGVIIAGIGLLPHQIVTSGAARNASMVLPWTALPGLGGIALMLVAACSPPGWLWDSEFGGFDALAYHLELPQEWLARGWLWPVSHNVYSYLPGYVESAYLHLAVFRGGATLPSEASPMIGLLSGDGSGVLSCQLLHAGLTVCAGVLVGRATRVAADRCGLPTAAASAGAGLASSLFLLTPWTIVVGSLAYNEAGMTALGAGALLAAMDDRIPAARRGLMAGLLVGIACGAKPTALTMIGVPVGIALLAMAPLRDWWRLVLPGAIAGGAAVAPWLFRNWYACGNPVFPFAAGLFGAGHWSAEQVERYLAAHRFQGSLLDALQLMFLPEHSDTARANHRGLFHAQWFAFFPICFAGGAGAIMQQRTRRIGLVLLAGMALQLFLWLVASHIQSRFLVPLSVTGAVVCGLAATAFWPAQRSAATGQARRGVFATLLVVAGVAQGLGAVVVFAQQRGGLPNRLLLNNELGGVNSLSAEAVRAARAMLAAMPDAERREAVDGLAPLQFVDIVLPPRSRIYLLGDSAVLYFRPPFVAHSTYDASPLGVAMRAGPDNPSRWAEKLRAEGIDLVMVNMSELERLRRSGWYDPMVTPEAVAEWLATEATLIRQWPTGQALFSLSPASGMGQGVPR